MIDQHRTADVIIVGGGCIGISAAAHLLLRRPTIRVVLLEKGELGNGTTARSSAIVRGNYTQPELAQIARLILDEFAHFESLYGGDSGFRQTGYTAVFGPDDADAAAANVDMQHQYGITTRILNKDDLVRRFPGITLQDLAGAISDEEAGYAEPSFVVATFARLAVKAGLRVIEHMPATGLTKIGDHYSVQTLDGSWEASQVLLATNAWTNQLLASVGESLPIKSTRHQVAAVAFPSGLPHPAGIFTDLRCQFYMRPEGLDRAQIGSSRDEDANDIVDPDSYKDQNDVEYIDACAAWLRHRFRGWDGVGLESGYSGVYDVTPDWQPILGALPGHEGLFVACGFSGHGFKLSPVIGRGLSDVILTGETSLFPFERFSSTRFDSGELILPHSRYSSGFLYR